MPFAVSATSLALLSTIALASPEGGSTSADKRFRLSVETEVFGFAHFAGNNYVAVGVGRLPIADTAFALVPQHIAIGFAYLFPNQQLLLGGRAGFSFFALTGDQRLVGGSLLPYVRWLFLPGKRVRPYLEGHFGFSGWSTWVADVEGKIHAITPFVGGGGGAHFFIVDAVSIDVGLNLDYAAPHSRTTSPLFSSDWAKGGDAVQLNIMAGLSGWF